MGAALTKRRLVKAGKPLSSLMLNNDGEPLLRNKGMLMKEEGDEME